MSTGTYQDLLSALGKNESGNNYGFVSSLGYLGRFQLGEEALQAVGFYGGDSTAAIDFVGGWTATAASFGVVDTATFLQSPIAQDAAMQAWLTKVDNDLNALGLEKYVGQTIGGVTITTSGLLAGGHLGGVWNLKTFLESGGAVDWRDGYGTPISQYVRSFGNFDTPFSSDPGPSHTVPSAGDDSLIAGAGAPELHAGAGNDTLTGWSGGDTLWGDDGNDSIVGGSGFDNINGNRGDDTIDGGSGGDDWLVGGQGNDLITAHAGGNILYGNIGNDTLNGGSGNEILRGGQGDDVIYGGAGNDWLSGDRGNDTLTGGAGADIFHTFADAGMDRVTDFNASEGDRVMVDPGSAYTVHQVGADTVIDLTGGAQMVLVNVQLSSLPSGWIF
ncbi:calcium-binding protein [Phenylobacterium hankyongense]|uniref:Calcium-binding protein n=1 Tax=Phenylobacterium hankyongense TaxID=1813876 RepID=A0A328B1D7_9CAUL|nr:calcium-binding protein [Phenylobacterium hankyongense]RAK58808.1 calcium-binding protein [Phenylobacterium hankyongense]